MSELSIKPLADRVVVRPLSDVESGAQSASGIIIPDSVKKEQAGEGVIVAVGAGKWDKDMQKRVPMDVKVGDVVLFAKYSGTEIKMDGKKYLIMRESDLLGIVG